MKISHGAFLVVTSSTASRSPFPKGEGIDYQLDFIKYQGKIRNWNKIKYTDCEEQIFIDKAEEGGVAALRRLTTTRSMGILASKMYILFCDSSSGRWQPEGLTEGDFQPHFFIIYIIIINEYNNSKI